MPRWSFTTTLTVVIAAIGLAGCPQSPRDSEPVANFSASPRTGNTGLTVSFSDLSTSGAGGPIIAWRWDFGDGNRSSAPNPTHTYLAEGSFDVSLTVTSSGGSHTRTRNGYIQISSPGGSANLGPEGGTAAAAGVRITAAAGALDENVAFGITRVNTQISFNVFETINRVGDTFEITHDAASTDVAASTADAPVQPLELAIPYAEDVVPTGSRVPGKVHIIAELERGLVVPLLGQIRAGAVVAPVLRLPNRARYTVVYRPDAYLQTVSTAAKARTSVNWNSSWQLSLSPELLRQLTALRLGSVQRPNSFGARAFTSAQLEDTVAALQAGLAALQADFEAVRGRSPRLVTLGGSAPVLFFNSAQTYPAAVGGIDQVFYAGSPFGAVVVDPAQLLAISTWNADRVAADETLVDIAFKLDAPQAVTEVVTRAVVDGYDYPEIHVPSPADGASVPFEAALIEGLALYLGQVYGGVEASRAQLDGDYTLLSTPLMAPADPSTPGYAASAQEFFRYLQNRYAPANPVEYLARGTGAVKGLLGALADSLEATHFVTAEIAGRQAATALDNAVFAYLGVPLGEAYREFALDLAFEQGEDAILRPSDAERLPLVLDTARFAPGAQLAGSLGAVDGLDITAGLANIPPLSSRVVRLSVDPDAASLSLAFNRAQWQVDARNQGIAIVVYREGLPGVALGANSSELVFTGFEADLGLATAEFYVLIINASTSTANSVAITAITAAE